MPEAITGCFSQSGGVPELGLGNAEVNVIFNTWMLHLTLCENARQPSAISHPSVVAMDSWHRCNPYGGAF